MKNSDKEKLPPTWNEMKDYRKKLHSQKWMKGSTFLIVIWTFVGTVYVSSIISSTNFSHLNSFLLYFGVLIPILLNFIYFTWREWKERRLISGIFLVMGILTMNISFTFRISMWGGLYTFLDLIILAIMLLLYGLAPVDLLRIKLRGENN